MTLSDVKKYLRVDGTANDVTINLLIDSTKDYIIHKTGKDFIQLDESLAKLYLCERVKSLYYPDYDNLHTLNILLSELIDKADFAKWS